jgi:hypothetical protein
MKVGNKNERGENRLKEKDARELSEQGRLREERRMNEQEKQTERREWKDKRRKAEGGKHIIGRNVNCRYSGMASTDPRLSQT